MKAKARSSILTHKSVARTASSAAEQLHDMHSKKGFGLLRATSEMGLLVWASNYASPGLTVLGSRRPGPPAPAQAGTRGAKKWCVPAHLRVPLVHSLINHFRQKANN